MLARMPEQTSRRAFLGLAAAGVAGAVSACSNLVRSAGGANAKPAASSARSWRNPVPENSLPGTSDWVIRNLGGEHEIEGYTGKASLAQGEPLPLFVSTTARAFTATAYRLGWYQGHGARQVWKSGTVPGGGPRGAAGPGAPGTGR